jgi:hypothetical protein
MALTSREYNIPGTQLKVEQWSRWHSLSVSRLSFIASLAISKRAEAQNIEDSL